MRALVFGFIAMILVACGTETQAYRGRGIGLPPEVTGDYAQSPSRNLQAGRPCPERNDTLRRTGNMQQRLEQFRCYGTTGLEK
ncbi:hypothetical protein K2X33_13445 [bacterium]|nr:hypothetical protein [bacterium]